MFSVEPQEAVFYCLNSTVSQAISKTLLTLYTPTPVCIYSLYCSLYISLSAGWENLFNNQQLLQSMIIPFILVTLVSDSGVIL